MLINNNKNDDDVLPHPTVGQLWPWLKFLQCLLILHSTKRRNRTPQRDTYRTYYRSLPESHRFLPLSFAAKLLCRFATTCSVYIL